MVDKIALIESPKNIKTALLEIENSEGIPAQKVCDKLRKNCLETMIKKY